MNPQIITTIAAALGMLVALWTILSVGTLLALGTSALVNGTDASDDVARATTMRRPSGE